MKLYNYDPHTGAYLNASDADPDPMVPGEYLIPAFATNVAPPAQEAGKVALFDAKTGRWTLKDVETPASESQAPQVSFTVKVQSWRMVVKAFLDMVAVAYGFDDMAEAVTYADEPAVPAFQVLGAALRAWRSLSWDAFEQECIQISAGNKPEPQSDDDVRAMLPAFTAPAEPAAPANELQA